MGQRFVTFAVIKESGELAVAGIGENFGPLRDAARAARDKGVAVIGGEAAPIVGGSVFSNVPLGPAMDFKCLSPSQRKAKEESETKADKEAKAKADAEAKAQQDATDKALLEAAARQKKGKGKGGD